MASLCLPNTMYFRDLPFEVRRMVYTLLIPDVQLMLGENSVFRPRTKYNRVLDKASCPSMLLTSRQIFLEMITTFYEESTFNVSLSKRTFSPFRIPHQTIKRPEGWYTHITESPRWITLPSEFFRLQHLCLNIKVDKFGYNSTNKSGIVKKLSVFSTTQDVASCFSTKLSSLQTLKIRIDTIDPPSYRIWNNIVKAEGNRQQLRLLLEREFSPLRKFVVRQSVTLVIDCGMTHDYTKNDPIVVKMFYQDFEAFQRTRALWNDVCQEFLRELEQDIMSNSRRYLNEPDTNQLEPLGIPVFDANYTVPRDRVPLVIINKTGTKIPLGLFQYMDSTRAGPAETSLPAQMVNNVCWIDWAAAGIASLSVQHKREMSDTENKRVNKPATPAQFGETSTH